MRLSHDFTRLPNAVRGLARAELDKATRSIEMRDEKIAQIRTNSRLSKRSVKFLTRLQGLPRPGRGFPLSSNKVRLASTIAMIEEAYLYARQNDDARSGQSRFRLLTCSPNIGICGIAQPDFPAVRTKSAITRLIRKAPVTGLMTLDFGLFSPEPLQAEDQLAIHVHGIVMVQQAGRVKVADMIKAMSPADPSNCLGAPVTTLRVRGSGMHASLADSDILGLGRYATKVSCGTNTMFQAEGGQRSQSNTRDWTPIGALRQLEIESYVDALTACWSVGENGSQIRINWRRRFFELLDYDEQPRGSRIQIKARYKRWRRVWNELDCGIPAADPAALLADKAPR